MNNPTITAISLTTFLMTYPRSTPPKNPPPKNPPSIVPDTDNSGHVVVPKAWIGKEAIVTLKEKETGRSKKDLPMILNVAYAGLSPMQ